MSFENPTENPYEAFDNAVDSEFDPYDFRKLMADPNVTIDQMSYTGALLAKKIEQAASPEELSRYKQKQEEVQYFMKNR